MYCSKCGHKNKEGAHFCLNCGEPLEERRSKKPKKRKGLYIGIAAAVLLAGGIGAAQLIGDDDDERQRTEQPTEETADANKEEAPEPEEPKEEETPEPSAGEVTKVETIQPPAEQQQPTEPKTREKTAIIKETQQKVYTIKTENGYGSGFSFTDSGTVVTNAHVVAGFTDVMVRNVNGQEQPGKVIGISDKYDVALIKVDAYEGIAPLQIEMNPTDVGTEVIALGSPSGFENTASIGYLTGIDRDFEQDFLYEDIYQIDAQIAPGSSGGPLIDAKTGKVIGINSLLFMDGSEIGFSIPMHSMVDLVTGWANSPMTAEQVAAIFPAYDDFENYEGDDYEYDYENEGNLVFDEVFLSEFIGDFRYYYEIALNSEDFFYVEDMLLYDSPAHIGIRGYITEITGQGMGFAFTDLEITSVEINEDHALVHTYEAFDFLNAAGETTKEERNKTYTVVMDDSGFYYISDITNQ